MNTQSMPTSFKKEILAGVHVLGTDVLKAALFLASASLGAATTVYSATGEVAGTNYAAGGIVLPSTNPPEQSGTTGFWNPSGNLVWANVTLSTPFDCALVYNSSKSNKAVSVNTFGSQVITAGTLTLTMPADDAVNALIRIE